jgi:glutamate-5-semialdehyde dehydrogenase
MGVTDVRARAEAARAAGRALAALPGERRSRLLGRWADALDRAGAGEAVRRANEEDLAAARDERIAPALLARLRLDAGKVRGLAGGLRQLAAMADRVGVALERRELDEGLVLERVSAPLGVLAVVFESRPDALVQIAGLALRTGNAAVLKGGREARRTNETLAGVLRAEIEADGLDPAALTLLEGREEVQALLGLDDVVDLVVARGSSEFVAALRAASRIPVLSHAAGVCHLYVHESADADMAARLAVDAKCTYPAACNSIETLLWDAGAGDALDRAVAALREAGVELRGDEATRRRHPAMAAATEADWDAEYGALVLAVRQVEGVDGALAHVARHGSRHTEAIVASDAAAAERFLREVDAASVFWNASTRFADGFRFGLGAEVGISTDKLHARGPVGAAGLLTYRWLLRGTGQRSADYGPGGRAFTHRDLPK